MRPSLLAVALLLAASITEVEVAGATGSLEPLIDAAGAVINSQPGDDDEHDEHGEHDG